MSSEIKPNSSESATEIPAFKPRILVVDDSKVLRKAGEKILGKEFDVVLASDGEEGWEKIAVDEIIQVVFLDLFMPQLDGYGLLERIRHSEFERINELPVIIVTGGEGEETRQKVLDLGATDFITKPFDTVNLLARARANSVAVHKNDQLRKEYQHVKENSTVDSLTKLGNKALLVEKLKQDRSFTSRHRLPLSIIAIDVDSYKNIFVKNGKPLAEGIVKQVAKMLGAQIRKEDTAARVGVSQLVVSLPTASSMGVYRLAERLQNKIAKSKFSYNGTKFSITVSICISTPLAKELKTADELMEETLAELKKAVGDGGNKIVSCQSLPDFSQSSSSISKTSKEEANKDTAKSLSLQDATALLDQGDCGPVYQQLDHLLGEMMPLLKMLNAHQKQTLIKLISEP